MKKLLATLILAGALNAHSQEIKYYPFCYEGKWGIADAGKNEVVAPEAAGIDFLEDSKSLIFLKDAGGKNFFFDITNGTRTETRGAVSSQLSIGKETYYLMKSDKEDYLYSLATKKEFPQKLKYKFMYSQELTDEKGKVYNYVIGYLTTGKIVVMDGNSPQLKQVLQGTFDAINFVTLDYKEYGTILKSGNAYYIYTAPLKLKGRINSDAEYLMYEDGSNAKLRKIYGQDVNFLSDIDFAEFRRDSKGLAIDEKDDIVTLSREENGKTTVMAVIENPNHAQINFEEFKGMELFRLITNWIPDFAGFITEADGKKELMVPAKYTGL